MFADENGVKLVSVKNSELSQLVPKRATPMDETKRGVNNPTPYGAIGAKYNAEDIEKLKHGDSFKADGKTIKRMIGFAKQYLMHTRAKGVDPKKKKTSSRSEQASPDEAKKSIKVTYAFSEIAGGIVLHVSAHSDLPPFLVFRAPGDFRRVPKSCGGIIGVLPDGLKTMETLLFKHNNTQTVDSELDDDKGTSLTVGSQLAIVDDDKGTSLSFAVKLMESHANGSKHKVWRKAGITADSASAESEPLVVEVNRELETKHKSESKNPAGSKPALELYSVVLWHPMTRHTDELPPAYEPPPPAYAPPATPPALPIEGHAASLPASAIPLPSAPPEPSVPTTPTPVATPTPSEPFASVVVP
jgi:hypothetical protein